MSDNTKVEFAAVTAGVLGAFGALALCAVGIGHLVNTSEANPICLSTLDANMEYLTGNLRKEAESLIKDGNISRGDCYYINKLTEKQSAIYLVERYTKK